MVGSSALSTRCRKAAFARGWIAAGILLALWHGAANAESSPPPMCESNALAQYQIKNLAASDEKVRVSAAKSIIESWRSTLPSLIAEIQQLKKTPASTWPESEQQRAVFLTEIVKTILASSDQSIALFRQCDNEMVVKTLIWAARGDNKSLRVNAANILANTIDNTTICFILHHLRDNKIDANGRANLLGITVAMANYAYKDNVDAIVKTLDVVQAGIAGKEGMAQTQKLAAEIGMRALKSSNANTPLPDGLKDYCRGYRYAEPLE